MLRRIDWQIFKWQPVALCLSFQNGGQNVLTEILFLWTQTHGDFASCKFNLPRAAFTRSIMTASSGHEIPQSLRAFPARHLD